jgi:predicted metal-dependent HD superfamily phosphohydrolase
MLQDLEELPLSKARKSNLQLAIFYHDYIYSPGASDNEMQSKIVFDEDCKALGVDPLVGSAALISKMILSTAYYETQGSVNDLGDLDLATLALPYDEYTYHGKLLFEEYSSRFLESQMIEGRRDFLVRMLSLPKIFNHDPERDSRAQLNMGRQLAELLRWSK